MIYPICFPAGCSCGNGSWKKGSIQISLSQRAHITKCDYSKGVDISVTKIFQYLPPIWRIIPIMISSGDMITEEKAGILHIADHHVSPGKKQWTWGCGEFGQAWDRNLTDEDGPYMELMTGCFTDNQPDFSWLQPYEEKVYTQYFMPYKKVGR